MKKSKEKHMNATKSINSTPSKNVVSARAMCCSVLAVAAFIFLPAVCLGQIPTPEILQVQPVSIAPGNADFTLTVTGTGFFSSGATAAIQWNGAALPNPTICVFPPGTHCSVKVPAANVASAGTAIITVVNTQTPAPPPPMTPMTATSNPVFFLISQPAQSLLFGNTPFTAGLPAGQGPMAIAAADLTTAFDPSLQLPSFVVANSTGLLPNSTNTNNTISNFIGDFLQPGTFLDISSLAVGHNPQALAIADFNGDGNPDIAVVNENDNSVSLFQGNGKGAFTPFATPTVAVATGEGPFAIVAGDFDGDGNIDLAVLSKLDDNCPAMNNVKEASVSFLLGDGKGGFSSASANPVCLSFTPVAMAAGDFDEDGFLDLAITNGSDPTQNCAVGSGTVELALSATLPLTIPPPPKFAAFCAGKSPVGIVAADFDGDGHLDVAVANAQGGGGVTPLFGDGTGAFKQATPPAPVTYPANTPIPGPIIAGDFNSDGMLDIAVADQGSSTVSILLQQKGATFTPGTPFSTQATDPTNPNSTVGHGPVALVAADFNKDGKLDIATANFNDNDVTVMLQGPAAFTLSCDASDPAPTPNTAGCSGPTPPTTLPPPLLAFGDQGIATTSSALLIDVKNIGSAALILQKTVAGPFAVDATSTTCTGSLAVGGQCTIGVVFMPPTIGQFSGNLSVVSGGPAVGLSGTGVGPSAQLGSLFMAFGDQQVGTTSSVMMVTVTNAGNAGSSNNQSQATLTISNITLGGSNANDYTITSGANSCMAGSMIAVNGTCMIYATFNPVFQTNPPPMPPTIDSGLRTAQIQITDNSNGVANGSQAIALSGNGTLPQIAISSPPLLFGNQQVDTTSGPETITLTNTGAAPLSLKPPTVTGPNAADFIVDLTPPGSCAIPGSLAISASCMVTVRFTPTYLNPAVGPRSATLNIMDDSGLGPSSTTVQLLSMSGTATFPVVNISTNLVQFGGVPITTTSVPMTFTLANVGTAPLNLNGIADSNAAEFAESDNCPRSPVQLAVNTFCTITVRLTPSSVGAQGATLTFTDTNLGGPSDFGTPSSVQTVTLSGTGTDFTLSVAPTSITIAPSKTATYTITLNPIDGFNNPIAFVCAGGPPHSNCFISGMLNGSASVILSTSQGANHGTFTLTFTGTFTASPPASGTLSHFVTASITIK
jgi:hypothetical protein